MGYGKGGGSTADTYTKGHEDTYSDTNSSYEKKATFDPAGKQALTALGSNFGNVGNDSADALRYYKEQLSNSSINPYYRQMIEAQNKVANKQFADRLAQVRSSGYGGGVGRDTQNQSQAAADFTAQQQANNSNILANAYNQLQQQQQTSAGALGALDTARTNEMINFLNTLRGETGTGRVTTNSRTNKYSNSLTNNIWAEGGGGFGGS